MTEDELLFLAYVGEQVKRYRMDAGITQQQVADTVGLSRASIANMEAGRQQTSAHDLTVFARLFGIAVSDLLPDEDREPVPLTRATVAQRRAGVAAMHWADATYDFQQALDELGAARKAERDA